jgi:hypothetical protein
LEDVDAVVDGLADLGDLDVVLPAAGLLPKLIGNVLVVGLAGTRGLDGVRTTISFARMSLNLA